MKLACRMLMKGMRAIVKRNRQRAQKKIQDELLRQSIIENKGIARPWRDVQLFQSSIAPAQLQKQFTFRSKILKVQAKQFLNKVFETQAIRQRKQISIIVSAAEEGNVIFLQELLSFRRRQQKSAGDDDHHMRHKIFAALRRRLGTMSSDVHSGFQKSKEAVGDDTSLVMKMMEDFLKEDVNFEDRSGHTPLFAALENRRWECARILLSEPDIDVSVAHSATRMFPLHMFLSKDGIGDQMDLLQKLVDPKWMHKNLEKPKPGPIKTDSLVSTGKDSSGKLTKHLSSVLAVAGEREAGSNRFLNSVTNEKVTCLMIAAGNIHLGTAREVSPSFASKLENEGSEHKLHSSGKKDKRGIGKSVKKDELKDVQNIESSGFEGLGGEDDRREEGMGSGVKS
jgi:hypothetical protein